MEAKSSDIKDGAANFSQNAHKLMVEAKRRQCRLYFILGVITFAILMYIIVPLASSDDKE
jgi:hypothetical protein